MVNIGAKPPAGSPPLPSPTRNFEPRLHGTVLGCIPAALYHGTVWLAAATAAAAIAVTAVLFTLRFIDPPTSAFMLRYQLAGGSVAQTWVPLERMSPALVRAVIASEDAGFCRHHGIAFAELRSAIQNAQRRRSLDVPGASTITMQVVKNLFLWRERSLARKGAELIVAPVMEVVWTKRRILEVYLNIAEWAPGVFGAEQAARHHFRRSASRLSAAQAALLAAALPNPKVRRAGRPGPKTRRTARTVRQRARRFANPAECIPAMQ